jgi:hypothetical protein
MVMGIVLQTVGFIIGKLIYTVNPDITTFEIITSRALVQVIFNECLMKYFQTKKHQNGVKNAQVMSYADLSRK